MKARQTPKTHDRRRREWRDLWSGGRNRYSSRWGEYTVGIVVGEVRLFTRGATLVDPGLTRSEREELEVVLKQHHRSRPDSGSSVTVLCVTFFLTGMLLLSPLARSVPDTWRIWLPVALLLVPVIAATAACLWFQRKGTIPEKFRGRLLTGHEEMDGPYLVSKADVFAVAKSLGDLENTPGTTNAEVDDQWRRAWAALTSATKQAEKNWAASPVDDRMPA